MDPLSLTASIIAVIGLASNISNALRSVYDLRHAPREILELANEVSELQALLSLVQKATDTAVQDSLSQEDLHIIQRLIDSAQDSLIKLEELVTACSSKNETSHGDGDKSISRLNVSFSTWMKSKKSISKIQKSFLRAHRNINTALTALNNIHRQADYRVILNMHDLVLHQVQASENAYPKSPRTMQELEGDISSAMSSCTVNEEKTGDVVKKPHLTHSPGQLAVLRPENSGPATNIITTRQFPEGISNPCWSNNDDPRRFDRHASTGSTCSRSCPCQCQLRKSIESPRWSVKFLANLFYSYTGTLQLQPRPCNHSECQQKKTVSCQLTYHFPQWFTKKTFALSAHLRVLSGLSGSWSIRFPRSISASHNAWKCIEQGQYEGFLRMLRERTILVDDMADDDGTPLLLFALKFRRDDVVELLLDHGANPHLMDPRGVSACAYAQSSLLIDQPAQTPVWSTKLNMLLTEGSAIDELCFTPLHEIIIGFEKADLHQQLRLNRYCINTPDSLGRSPLHWAVIHGDISAVAAILAHGAFPDSRDKEQMTPLLDLCQSPQSTQAAACARLLIDAGADVDARDSWGRTALRIAVGFPSTSLDLIEMLLDKGADVNVKDIYDQTPLLKSIRGNPGITQLLLKHEASTEIRDIYGNTPLSEAIYRNSAEHLKLLLEYGAKTNTLLELHPGRRAREGPVNILHFTAWYGGIEVMRALEGSDQYVCLDPQPIDDFVQHRGFRLSNGLGGGEEDYDAFVHLLSTIKHTCEKSRCSCNEKADDDEEGDDFADAEENVFETVQHCFLEK